MIFRICSKSFNFCFMLIISVKAMVKMSFLCVLHVGCQFVISRSCYSRYSPSMIGPLSTIVFKRGPIIEGV